MSARPDTRSAPAAARSAEAHEAGAPCPADRPLIESLGRELGRKNEEIALLRQVSSRVNTTLKLEEICELLLGTMAERFGFGHALILLLEPSGGELRVVAGRGYPESCLGARVPVGVGVIGTVARRRKLLRIGNLSQRRAYIDAVRRETERSARAGEIDPAPDLPGLADAETQIAIPLLVGERLVGVFSVESAEPRTFGDRDETLATIVANLAAVAIHNAQLYRQEELRRASLEGTVEQRTRELERASHELSVVRELRAKETPRYAFTDLVGESAVMSELRDLLRKVARSPSSTILITGENGTGKDLAAKVLHWNSQRAPSPFMNITCSALAENLLESELFGHERGAFTDAKQDKRGLLELAHGGTVFLDEIGEMSLTLQSKLLRFLEEKTFKRVGGSRDIRVDVRIVAATNRDLARMVEEGRFREDLYYRLKVLPVEMPPLRVRSGDIPALVRQFVRQFQKEFGKELSGVAPEALERLAAYSWPGNVRELRNAVERAMLLCEGPTLTACDFAGLAPLPAGDTPLRLPPGGIDFEALERNLVVQALERAGWNKARAARLLGMPRDWLRYRMEKFRLTPPGE